jgi:ketosteroid isomerase-like protein
MEHVRRRLEAREQRDQVTPVDRGLREIADRLHHAQAGEVLTTGKVYKQTYAGRLVAENGKIKLVREALDTLAAHHAFNKD